MLSNQKKKGKRSEYVEVEEVEIDKGEERVEGIEERNFRGR